MQKIVLTGLRWIFICFKVCVCVGGGISLPYRYKNEQFDIFNYLESSYPDVIWEDTETDKIAPLWLLSLVIESRIRRWKTMDCDRIDYPTLLRCAPDN